MPHGPLRNKKTLLSQLWDSDPVSAQLVHSLEAPGSNLTGTSDYLDTNAVMNLIFAAQPGAKKIGLELEGDSILRSDLFQPGLEVLVDLIEGGVST